MGCHRQRRARPICQNRPVLLQPSCP